MAAILADGFDHYGSNTLLNAEHATNNFTLNSSVVRSGTRSIRGDGTAGCAWRRVIPGGPFSFLGVAFGFRVDALPTSDDAFNDCNVLSFRDGSNNQMARVELSTTGALMVFNAANSLVDTTDPVITAGTWHHIEIQATFAGGSGSLEIRVDEVEAIALTSINIGSAATCEQIAGDDDAGSGGPTNMYYDDLFVYDDSTGEVTDWVGDCVCLWHAPTADTASADWTKSTGSDGYAIIDDIPPDSDYLEAANPAERSDFEMPAFSVSGLSEVLAVVRWSYVNKTVPGTATFVQGVVSGGTDGDGANHAPTTTAQFFMDVFETDPDTGSPWTVSAVEDMQIYIEKTV